MKVSFIYILYWYSLAEQILIDHLDVALDLHNTNTDIRLIYIYWKLHRFDHTHLYFLCLKLITNPLY